MKIVAGVYKRARQNRTSPRSVWALLMIAFGAVFVLQVFTAAAITRAQDPGVRTGLPDSGDPLAGVTGPELQCFLAGKQDFVEADDIADGLGPRMNLDSCGGCHAQPAVGGSSPAINPQVAFATKNGGHDAVPSFITLNGPVREAGFVANPDGTRDGGVHAVFTISGRAGAEGCGLAQPDFEAQVAAKNVIFRIPTPVFGGGLIEQIPDAAILANVTANGAAKTALGIRGRANFAVAGRTISGQTNNNGNDGTVARFGWKAQNKSLLLFSGEAYNVEMGISNELFQTERDETPGCQYAPTPNDVTNTDAASASEMISAVEKFAAFMRFLAPSQPSPDTVSITRGRQIFAGVGCAYCHTPTLYTGYSSVAA